MQFISKVTALEEALFQACQTPLPRDTTGYKSLLEHQKEMEIKFLSCEIERENILSAEDLDETLQKLAKVSTCLSNYCERMKLVGEVLVDFESVDNNNMNFKLKLANLLEIPNEIGQFQLLFDQLHTIKQTFKEQQVSFL